MKGKNVFSISEYHQLISLIKERVNTIDRNDQKRIRDKMRKIGFYGGDDFGVIDMNVEKFENLIRTGQIKIIGLESAKSSA